MRRLPGAECLSFGSAGAVILQNPATTLACALTCALAAALLMLAAGVAHAQTASPASADAAAAIRAAVRLEPATRIDGAQVSALRATAGPQLGDAVACLKLAGTPGGYIAVFFERGKVLSYRSAVAYDHCGEGPFTLLAAAAPAKTKRVTAAGKKPPRSPHHAEAK
jgi:hypothetical protein